MNQPGETCKETVSQGGGAATCVSVGTIGASRNANPDETTIKEFIPASWFHPVGVYKVLARLWDRLPDVAGKLFLTLTIDPKQFASEEAAFEHSRQWMRKVFYQLRQGVEHEGKIYQIDAPYCVKVEFHESGWVHYHVIFLTRRFLPKELLAELWGLGWVEVQRITTDEFNYLLAYVSKPQDIPAWVLKRKRLRIFQSTKGFLTPLPPEPKTISLKEPRQRASYTMDERFWRWACMAVLRQNGKARTIRFQVPYRDIFDHLVLDVAREGRYLGNGNIIINRKEGITLWLQTQSKLLAAKS
jgi:hypothetical protein